MAIKDDIDICACCGKMIDLTFRNRKDWAWKLNGKRYCSYSCYSKEFDKNYKAFKGISRNINISACRYLQKL